MHLEHVALVVEDYDAAIGFFVDVLAVEDGRLHVRPLEAVDGTPVLDLKVAL